MSGSTHRDEPARRRDASARPSRTATGLGRLVALTAAAAVAGTALLLRAAALAPRSAAAAGGLTVDRWVELAVLAAGLLAAAWLALSGALALACVAASRLGGRWRAGEAAVERLAPAAVRRIVRTAVGVGVGTGLALAPTVALAADPAPAAPGADGASVVLDLGWQPTDADAQPTAPPTDRESLGTADAAAPPAAPAVEHQDEAADDVPVEELAAAPVSRQAAEADAAAVTDDDGTRVVLRGDTLWDIAARSLGGSPTDAEVLREVTRWHAENRDVIGADPDLLLPGQILRAPA
ncbi:LysM peptidoglycan-binding domain-containing protein [Isoptericola variabilis]|uniref:LysM peptidoglycan-binding domain-containing protein n=1 Tax=Isoptericola variabilis TaxID=139208 RepID=UPI003D23AB95